MNISERREEIYNRASTELKNYIIDLRSMMEQCVELYEKIRDKAHAEDFSVEDTKMLIAIICDKMNLNSYYKRSFIKMVYPPQVDLQKLISKRFYDPPALKKDIVEEEFILRVTKSQIPENIMKHIMRVYQDWFEIRLVDGVPVNIRCDTEPEWALIPKWQEIAGQTTREIAALQT